ncbi:MAG TPA: sigma-70 family RNA polymerase sigma factor [Blastocatellia bacterium]
MMTAEEFREEFREQINGVLSRATRRYGVTFDEIASALYRTAKKHLKNNDDSGADELAATSCPGEVVGASRSTKASVSRLKPVRVSPAGIPVEFNGKAPGRTAPLAIPLKDSEAAAAVSEILATLNSDDLCLAVACAKGDEVAWEDFFRDYRSYLTSIARGVTQDQGAAEQLADSTFAELYGLPKSGGARVSKFSFYSGRGSLKGWLRAVVYQLSADIYRKTGRFVQTEDAGDLERLPVARGPESGELGFAGEQYESAVSDSLRRALAQLEVRERLLFAHYYYDEMTLREIGKLFGVHEATVCRWLAKAQKRTRKLVEKSLSHDHHLSRRQVSDAIQVAAERSDMAIRDYLIERVASDKKSEQDAKMVEGRAFSLRLD